MLIASRNGPRSVGTSRTTGSVQLAGSPGSFPICAHIAARSTHSATLQQMHLFALFSHPSGFFSQFDALWSHQSNRDDASDMPGDEFWQFNIFGGYRFARRRAELRIGVLNLTDRDYRLYPLNLTAELRHERTFYTSFRFAF